MELTHEQVQEKLCELSPKFADAIATDDQNALELVSTVLNELAKFE